MQLLLENQLNKKSAALRWRGLQLVPTIINMSST